MSIFISYRRGDNQAMADRINGRLVQKFGREYVFKDVDSLAFGRDFRTMISQAVGKCDVLLVLIGRQWLNVERADGGRRLDDPADFVRLEVEAALSRDIPVIPILVDGSSLPREEDLPESLRPLVYRHGIEIHHDPLFTPDMDRLIKALEAELTRPQTPPHRSEAVLTRQKTPSRRSFAYEMGAVVNALGWQGLGLIAAVTLALALAWSGGWLSGPKEEALPTTEKVAPSLPE